MRIIIVLTIKMVKNNNPDDNSKKNSNMKKRVTMKVMDIDVKVI